MCKQIVWVYSWYWCLHLRYTVIRNWPNSSNPKGKTLINLHGLPLALETIAFRWIGQCFPFHSRLNHAFHKLQVCFMFKNKTRLKDRTVLLENLNKAYPAVPFKPLFSVIAGNQYSVKKRHSSQFLSRYQVQDSAQIPCRHFPCFTEINLYWHLKNPTICWEQVNPYYSLPEMSSHLKFIFPWTFFRFLWLASKAKPMSLRRSRVV